MTTDTETTSASTFNALIDWQILADLASVGACSATDDARPILTGILLESTDAGELVAIATDSYRLARITTTLPAMHAGSVHVIIPAAWLAKTLTSMRPRKIKGDYLTRPVRVTIDAETITLEADGITASTPLIAGTYPSVSQLIPTEKGYEAELGAFNPTFLWSMAKMLTRSSTDAWRCVTMSATRPTMWITKVGYRAEALKGASTRGEFLLMPVRLDRF